MGRLPDAIKPKTERGERHVYGTVESAVNGYASVRLAGGSAAKCEAFCECSKGDRVLVLVMASGRCAVVGRRI